MKIKKLSLKMKRSMLLAGYTVHYSLSLLLTLKTHLYNTASSPRILTTSLYLLASFSFQPISSGLYYLTVFPWFDFTVYDESKSNVYFKNLLHWENWFWWLTNSSDANWGMKLVVLKKRKHRRECVVLS